MDSNCQTKEKSGPKCSTRLVDFGYLLKYPESVRRAALTEASKQLTRKGVFDRLDRMLAKQDVDERVRTDYSWFLERHGTKRTLPKAESEPVSVKNIVPECMNDDSIAMGVKKRRPRASATKAMESITVELQRGLPEEEEEEEEDRSYHPESDSGSDSGDEDDDDDEEDEEEGEEEKEEAEEERGGGEGEKEKQKERREKERFVEFEQKLEKIEEKRNKRDPKKKKKRAASSSTGASMYQDDDTVKLLGDITFTMDL